MREEIKTGAWLTAAWFWFFVLLIAGAAITMAVKPYFVRQETRIIRQSNAYITSKQAALSTLRADWERLAVTRAGAATPALAEALEAQQAGIVRQMEQEAALIPDDVPPEMASWLRARSAQ